MEKKKECGALNDVKASSPQLLIEGTRVKNFTVLMSVYHKEKPQYLKEAVLSVMKNTILPNEVIIVEDGPLTNELYSILDEMQRNFSCIKRIKLSENVGLAKALNTGINVASNELIARMDTDDICVPDRFERQLKFLSMNSNVDVLGGQIIEFDESMSKGITRRFVPKSHEEIVSFAERRNPINHMTVVYKKSVIESVGGYRPIHYFEDYDLWVRLILHGATFANLPDVLVHVRAGDSLFSRRGGLKYARCEINFLIELYRLGFLSFADLFVGILSRTAIRLMPNRVRKLFYKTFLRKKENIVV
ncbi:glycosyltransferase [Pseudothermotoga sp. U03pept]|uniref:glycosyltransferase n=1 Tax=Pseudothermotoga sp. U03pept TaxID=3447012 RepID=UPI003F06832C